MFAAIISLILFAIFMTGSPGPGNLLMMAGGASLNFKKCTYFLIGLVTGKTLVNLLILDRYFLLEVAIVESLFLFCILCQLRRIYIKLIYNNCMSLYILYTCKSNDTIYKDI